MLNNQGRIKNVSEFLRMTLVIYWLNNSYFLLRAFKGVASIKQGSKAQLQNIPWSYFGQWCKKLGDGFKEKELISNINSKIKNKYQIKV